MILDPSDAYLGQLFGYLSELSAICILRIKDGHFRIPNPEGSESQAIRHPH